MSTIASLIKGLERDALAYTRVAEEARRAIEVSTRSSRELAHAIRDATTIPRSVAEAVEEVLRSAREAAHLNRLVEGLSRPVTPTWGTKFFSEERTITQDHDDPEEPRIPFGFHPQR